jgi:peptide-methionine (S)-S-oxide reductase
LPGHRRGRPRRSWPAVVSGAWRPISKSSRGLATWCRVLPEERIPIQAITALIDYQGILDHFWVNHDPFDARGQFCDKGHEYLAAIFVADDEERALAEKSRQKVVERFPDMTVVTPILPRATFYPIEGDEVYHQDYYKKSPLRYKYYRFGCGRDSRLEEIWGDRASRQ